jgi:mono/diheme cytochrome c family protein
MRYFLTLFALAVVAIMVVAGKRGDLTRRPPIELFPDMDRQPKLRPQAQNNFFPDHFSSRLPVEGTIARSKPYEVSGKLVEVNGQPAFPYEDSPINTGKITGTTNFIELNPLPITAELLQRGRQRYEINCLPCHGAAGDAKGVIAKYSMINVANFHDQRFIQMPDGEIFNTITHGSKTGLMGAYGPNVTVQDRWAVIAYLRVLQRSWLASIEDVPEKDRAALKK